MIKLKDIKMKPKLIGLFLIAGIVPLAIVGWWCSRLASEALLEQSYNQLEAVRGIKKSQIESFFEERQGDMGVLMETVGTLRKESFEKLSSIRNIKKTQIEKFFSERIGDARVLADSPFIRQAMKDLDAALDAGGGPAGGRFKGYTNEKYDAPKTYRTVHDKYFPNLKFYMEEYGYYDLFLMSPEHGDVSFTVTKEADFGQRTKEINSSLQDVWRVAAKEGRVALSDTKPYSPSAGAPAQFVAAPIKEGGKVIGVVALQISLEAVNAIMGERSGMGETGETYLVGQDNLMRSDSYLDPKYHSVEASFSDPVKGSVETEATREALSGKTDSRVIIDYNGNPVLSSYAPVKIGGTTWAVISEIDVAEAFCPKDESGKYFYEKYTQMYGYYDLFLINPDGYCFYTVAQESDYQSNFLNGKFSNSNLGSLVKNVLNTREFGMADFAPYAPSNNDPCSFIAQPVIRDGKIEIIVALQLSLDAINSIMQERDGMGKTGESYLVGSDKRMRSDSFLDPKGHSVKASFAGTVQANGVDTEGATDALSGNTDAKVILDYNGNPVLSAYTPLKIGDITWALLSEIDEAEVLGPVNLLKKAIAIIGVVLAIIVAVIGFIMARSIAVPIVKSAELADTIATGDLSQTVDIDQQDEVGILASSMMKMTSNLKETVGMAGKIAEGDLTVEVKTLSEKDALGHALKDMVLKLGSVMEDINSSASNVAAGSEEMSSTSQSMSQGATEQASSLEEISSSMNEIGSQTKQNAENASQANQLASDTKNAAESGNSQMKEMVDAMTEINASSQEISKIIKTIDEIAFQTNLLALNAAVEAARAGKQGKGFAVVAEEVRNLAARSAKAAKETADMIEGSVKKVEGGTEIANKTAEALGEIVGSVTKVTDIVGEIAAASNEQAQGISQITQGLGQIDQVTQQNTAHAEESASAAEELASQAQILQELVNTFKLASEKKSGSQIGTRNYSQIQNRKMLTETAPTKDNGNGGGSESTWGDVQGPAKTEGPVNEEPKPTIHLDDEEFGKY